MSALELRLAAYYGILFGSFGFIGPFFAPWLDSLGVSSKQIGLIVALPSFAMVLTTVYLGSAADRLKDWRTAVVASDWLIVLLLGWLLVRQSVPDIVIVWTLTGLLIAAKIPIYDAATLSLLQRQDGDYGRVRSFGSIGFIAGLLLAGPLFESRGFGIFVLMLLASAMARALVSLQLPRFRSTQSAVVGLDTTSLAVTLQHRGFWLVMMGAALINASHGFFNGFGMLHWLDSGLSESIGSTLFAAAVVAEFLLMWKFSAVARRISARFCMLIAAMAGILRWGLSTLALPVFYLYLLQTLHALSFGLLLVATLQFIARRVDDSFAARAQAVYATLSTGTLAVSVMVSGALYDRMGEQGYWVMALLSAAGAALILASYRTRLIDETALQDRRSLKSS